MFRAVAITAALACSVGGCGEVPAKDDAGGSGDARVVDAPVDAPTVLVVSASPNTFNLHAADTRETKITVYNGTTQAAGIPSLQVSGLTLGTLAFAGGTCTSSLTPGASCTAIGTLTATTPGQVSFTVIATTPSSGTAMTDLSATVMPACPATCGPSGNKNCCDSSVVPGNAAKATMAGATFFRSYDVVQDAMFSNKGYPATVSDFRLDTYEVTIGRFRAFVNAGYGTQAKPPAAGAGARALNGMTSQGGWDASWNANLPADTTALKSSLICGGTITSPWTDSAGANEALPINCLSWHVAMAFCIWDGGFLPTEAEWNYAAAGGTEQRAYPWSSPASSTTIDCSYANAYLGGNFCVTAGERVNRVGSESPKGDGRWAHADLAGNLWEYTLDSYVSPYPGATCDDCANLATSTERVTRGGGWSGAADSLRTALRVSTGASAGNGMTGVRCARTP